jgi:hypothetical protein
MKVRLKRRRDAHAQTREEERVGGGVNAPETSAVPGHPLQFGIF